MTGEEFDLLDELYFVQPFDHLKEELEWGDEELLNTLIRLKQKGFIKCYKAMDEEVFEEELNLKEDYKSYLYLATKQGLMAHNGR